MVNTSLTEISDQIGLDFVHDSGATGRLVLTEISSSGAALFDADNDGRLDVYLTNGRFALPGESSPGVSTGEASPGSRSRFFRQQPDGRLIDATDASGLGAVTSGMGVAVGDMDNDGDLDLLVTNVGPDRLFRNDGHGRFEDVTRAAGIDIDGWSSSAAFVDYDRDGFLDLYVARYVVVDPDKKCYDDTGRREYCGPKSFIPVSDKLLHNRGDGSFEDVSEAAGVTSVAAAGLGVVCDDLDGDGWIDIYVANDGYPNQVWINQGDGTFRDQAMTLGAAVSLNGDSQAGMGVVAVDFDNDLDMDVFVTNLLGESNVLYMNGGAGRGFVDGTAVGGLAAPSLLFTAFGTVALDIEHDGDLDLALVNGGVLRGEPRAGNQLPAPWSGYSQPNHIYINDGHARFTLTPVPSFSDPVEISRGLAAGDFDSDGDLDLLVSNVQSRARMYRNDWPQKGHWLAVRAVDPRLRRDAFGARIRITTGAGSQLRTIASSFSYLSASEPIAHFGLAGATAVDRIEVHWPDGLVEVFPGVPADRRIELVRGSGQQAP